VNFFLRLSFRCVGFNNERNKFPSPQLVSFNCCLSLHVDNYAIIIPTKCTRFLLLKAQDITICTFLSCILPLHVSTRVGHLQGAQCQCLAKVIIDYILLKLR
jgi:hypothetical protein